MVHVAFDYLDMILQVEMILFELETLFFGISLVDISVFVISSALLFRVDCLSVFFMYWFHLARGVVGFLIW